MLLLCDVVARREDDGSEILTVPDPFSSDQHSLSASSFSATEKRGILSGWFKSDNAGLRQHKCDRVVDIGRMLLGECDSRFFFMSSKSRKTIT